MRWVAALLVVVCLCARQAPGDVRFAQGFRIPAEQRIWAELNRVRARDVDIAWLGLDPRQDTRRSEDFWRQWPHPFSPFYAGVMIPAEQFVLPTLYHEGKLYYPQARYKNNPDYQTFFDLHESLAWLYAFDSPSNGYFRNRALRLRAQQLALAHLIGMVQDVPGGNIIGGWAIQYGNCLAWNARTLRWLDRTEPLDPELKAAWLTCLDFIATTLDAQGPNVLETGMGHWNLWPVCGAFELWQASGEARHRALFEKWAAVQLVPDAFTSGARFVSGISPAGYARYSGVDLGYNGQAKNWMAALFTALGTDSIVGDFARRQYQFASFVTVEEPDGSLSSAQHMNSHSPQSVPYEQWAFHKHIPYAVAISDAVPFAIRAGYAPTAAGGREAFIAQQKQMEGLPIGVGQIAFGVRSYPSNYLHLPEALAWYPHAAAPPDLSVRTRPMEHVAYAKWFRSPVVRDEFFVRRMPAFHVTLYSGPCRDEVSNAGGQLNAIGAGGLGQLWLAGSGTVLMAATDLAQKPAADGDFEQVWAQLPINAMVGRRADGRVVCTGWTGSLMEADAAGRAIRIRGGVAPALDASWRTPMTDAVSWERRVSLSGKSIEVEAHMETAAAALTQAAELLPIAFFPDTEISGITTRGERLAGPWKGRKRLTEIVVRRSGRSIHIAPDEPRDFSWGDMAISLSQAVGREATARALQVWLEPAERTARVAYAIRVDASDVEAPDPVRVSSGAVLPKATAGIAYRVNFETADARAVYWEATGGALPPGLVLERSGVLHGTPRAAGTFSFDLTLKTPYATRPFNERDEVRTAVTITVTEAAK
jgi:hypothetical protein